MSRAPRPKRGKIAGNPALWRYIQADLGPRWNPKQITRMLRRDFPDRPELRVVHETIYPALNVQAAMSCTVRFVPGEHGGYPAAGSTRSAPFQGSDCHDQRATG